ncbi:nucleotidyltransferase [Mucilaginibacter sp. HMF5004]|uniref:nucleotidyltransferase domain-containing protein n=1 Tax=Mucilaginibacter rivuli TaxID=2857527 RepID=UPI001C5DEEDF|nr:nucleotidyltransferase [Mucilaginibacter rivuli]MBW4891131.1 nucleotidyltransferase [Mucilaginibacter rivuli]
MAVSEQQLITWSKPLSKTEDTKCQNVVSQVTQVLRTKFGYGIDIFLQGSYQNDTNVKQDSDVDIVVRYNGSYFPNLVFLSDEQKRIYDANTQDASYHFPQFKNDVELVLKNKFGTDAKRKDKCIFIQGNTNRVNADVVPCFPMKRMSDAYTAGAIGIKFISDDGGTVESYPEQHYANGVTKNTATSRMYKRTVRMLKNIRNNLIDTGVIKEKFISSFFIESLVYNVPNTNFNQYNYSETLKKVIKKIYDDMDNAITVNEYVEVSELMYLFRGSDRSAADVRKFMLKCWEYAGF